MTRIYFHHRISDVLTDVTSVFLCDTGATFGVRRTDTMGVVVAANTALTHESTGKYYHDFTDPADDLIYQYELKWTYGGITQYSGLQLTAQTEPAASVTAPSVAFTSRDEIERLFSSAGVEYRIDDLTSSEVTDMFNEIVGYATDTVAAYTLHFYDNSAIYSKPWVRQRATFIAAWFLSRRRANPGQFGAEYEMVIADLEKVMAGKLMIPNAIVRAAAIPTVSSFRIDDRYRYQKLRVVQHQSTSSYPGQVTYGIIPGADTW